MTTTQRTGRGRARIVSTAAAAAALAAVAAITLAAAPAAPALTATRSPLARVATLWERGHSRSPWLDRWQSLLGRHGAHVPVLNGIRSANLNAPRPPAITATVGGNPVGMTVDPATHTLYVANGGSNSISVINTATCNATVTSGCEQIPASVNVGNGPLAVAMDHKTHTLYVTNLGGNTVSVVDASTCNATNTSGCGQPSATITVGSGPAILAVDQATDTIYVPNSNANSVSVIDGATCNATDTSGCAQTPPTITVGSGPSQIAFDSKTDTLYTANYNDNSVTVLGAAACNAQDTSGCGSIAATVPVGVQPTALAVDRAVGTLYVVNNFDDDVSMIRTAACNAASTAGCGLAPPTTPVGSLPNWVSINPLTGTVYVANQDDSNVSVIDAATCNAISAVHCAKRPPALANGFNGGAAVVDPSTDTVYATSQNNGTVTVLNGAACNAHITSGCTKYAGMTAGGVGIQPVAVNQATHTVYVANFNDNTVSVINALTCNPGHVAGCDQTWPTISVGPGPEFGLAVDRATDTVYVTNFGTTSAGNTVSVINGASCNATNTSGCGDAPTSITVGNCPTGLAINHATGTLYVANGCDSTVSVINIATCNGKNTSGCGQTPATVTTGNGPVPVGVNQATDTIYVGNNGDSTISVINGATCNAHTTSGCAQAPPAVPVPDNPFGLAVDQHTDTVYVADTGTEFFATGYANLTSSVSVINGATCNGNITSGCGQTPFAVPVGGFNWGVAVDPGTGNLYVTSIVDSDVAVINTATCNGMITTGCQPSLLHLRTGGWPAYIGLDPADGAMYITDNVDAATSVFPLS